MTTVYIVLGATGSGRREVVYDLIHSDETLAANEVAILISEDENMLEWDEKFTESNKVLSLNFQYNEEEGFSIEPIPTTTDVLFFITDGSQSPVSQIESIYYWISQEDYFIGRIITVVNSQLAYQNNELIHWYEACIHFSDVVLFNKRQDVPNRWFNEFQKKFEQDCYPCLFDIVKKGRIKNPAMILYPEPRRMSLIFDNQETEPDTDLSTVESSFSDEEPEEDFAEISSPDKDPFLKRNPLGARVRKIPDIAPFLSKKPRNKKTL